MPMPQRLSSKNAIGGIVSFAFSLFLIATKKADSSLYPDLVLGGMLLFAVLMMLESIWGKRNETISFFSWKEVLLLLVLFINPIGMQLFGFWITAYFEIATFTMLIEPKRTTRAVWEILVFCLLCVIASYCVFELGLRIRPTRGSLHLL
ncbi:MAG: tripartite tricarboxylate transporter TctB family protein [Sphaerochaetaceae bacterium]|jgi:hypothetical protein